MKSFPDDPVSPVHRYPVWTEVRMVGSDHVCTVVGFLGIDEATGQPRYIVNEGNCFASYCEWEVSEDGLEP